MCVQWHPAVCYKAIRRYFDISATLDVVSLVQDDTLEFGLEPTSHKAH